MAQQRKGTSYEQWMRLEGLPVYEGYGISDVGSLELGPWKRLGGNGAFIQLAGMEGLTGMYVGEIPPGGALNPEKHLYDELIYILSGRGAAEVWGGSTERPAGEGSSLEWQTGSLFAPPANTWHRLMNGSGLEPVRFLVATTAPLTMDLFHNFDFVFGCDNQLSDRYDGRPDYFTVGERRLGDTSWIWHTNFIPDVRQADIDSQEARGAGVRITGYEMAGNSLIGHMAEFPVGRYKKAHHHGGGAILLIVRSSGYSLMWPQEAGLHPYQNGHADKVVRVDWQAGSVFSPPTGWFHQHCNLGREPARQLAMRYGSLNHPAQFHEVHSGEGDLVSVKLGGNQIEYEDEDPELERLYRQQLAREGIDYRTPSAVVSGGGA